MAVQHALQKDLISSVDVLIVEDSRYFAKLLRSIIRSFGVRSTHVAYDAFEAFELLKSSSIDIVTVDLDLPGISGFELIQMIRRANDIANPNMPILVISADRRRSTVERAKAAGANDFAVKPMSADTLLDKMTRMATLAMCAPGSTHPLAASSAQRR